MDSFQIPAYINSLLAFACDVLTKLLEHSIQIFLLMLLGSGSEHVIHRDSTKRNLQVIIVLGLINSVRHCPLVAATAACAAPFCHLFTAAFSTIPDLFVRRGKECLPQFIFSLPAMVRND